MYHFTLYELVALFFIYSFAGWILETINTTLKKRNIVNRGLVSGPFCIIYGIAGIFITVGFRGLSGFWLFLFSGLLATVVEWTAGHSIEKHFHERWWDYSNRKWNLDGYICLTASALWGALGYIIIRWGNVLLLDILRLLPSTILKIIVLVMVILLVVDIVASFLLVRNIGEHLNKWQDTEQKFTNVSKRLEHWIHLQVAKRIEKAYSVDAKKRRKKEKKLSTIFAEGCNFYKIILLFFLGAFLGDITETIYCRITAGFWMSRSSVVWGPFSIVWGLAIAAVTALLYKYKDSSDRFLFWMGTLLGGVYEYLCSVFTEVVFGKVFWDYSKIPFNLGGRINLLYCFFWGIAAVVWFKHLFPPISKWIEKIPMKFGKIMTWCLIIFMIINMAVSSLAMIRMGQREQNIAATSSWQEWMDAHYDDETLARIYPNAKSVK